MAVVDLRVTPGLLQGGDAPDPAELAMMMAMGLPCGFDTTKVLPPPAAARFP